MSPETLLLLLDKLLVENLHGPIFPLPRNSRASATKDSLPSPMDDKDFDACDPRWKSLFISNFIDYSGDANDDLLFFVLDDDSVSQNDCILVKRRVANAGLPELNVSIDWKKTFFLNLISQISCYLTVAVCQKQEISTIFESDSNITSSANIMSNTGNKLHLDSQQKRQKMVATNRMVKKVFSAPYKSRMDVKDALMNECSFPFVYYTVNDFESESLQLEICQNEYLCVELCILLPQKLGINKDFTSMTRGSSEKANLELNDDLSPFPTPPDTSKIILFQGAVPFLSLSDVYSQKSLAAQTLKSSWSKLGPSSSLSNLKKTEYIMMRGPKGKGQCQVAINSLSRLEEEKKDSGLMKKLGGVASKYILGSLASDHSKSEESLNRGLIVSITYVNIAWQSIVNDLLQFAKESKSNIDGPLIE